MPASNGIGNMVQIERIQDMNYDAEHGLIAFIAAEI